MNAARNVTNRSAASSSSIFKNGRSNVVNNVQRSLNRNTLYQGNLNCALDQKDTLRASINTILDILDFYEPHNKRLVTLGNFPEACRSVQAVLFKYEISVSLIEERFFDLLDQPFNQDHKVHIREISNEFVDIVNLLGTELFETIKPFSDERDALIGADIKGAKETIRFEKEVLDRSKGNYSTPQSSNPAYNNNENQVIFNSIIGNEILTDTQDCIDYDHPSHSHSYSDSSSSSSYDSSSSSSFDSGGSF